MKSVQTVVRDVRPHWVGDGFPVRTLFSYREASRFDPFLMLDYAGPHEFAPAEAPRGVGEHPHRGFETVTIVYQGELEHRDSGGGRGSIGPGDVQWMTAASGVVHEEFHSERFARDGGVLEMVQLWVNLPQRDKLSPPKYQTLLDAEIPVVPLADEAGAARVIAGALDGVHGPAKTFTPINAWDLRLAAGKTAALPLVEGHTTLLVVQRGHVTAGGQQASAGDLIEFDRRGDRVELTATDEVRALLLSGQPLGEPVYGHGPFVMSSREEIEQAMIDYQTGKMGRLA